MLFRDHENYTLPPAIKASSPLGEGIRTKAKSRAEDLGVSRLGHEALKMLKWFFYERC